MHEAPVDLRDFLEACSEGRYYETLAERAGLPCGGGPERDAVKTFSCRLMYDKVHPYSRPWGEYKRHWPTTAERLELLKADDYHHASMELQRAETDVIIRGVCDDIRRDSGFPVVTIHDCLMVPREHEGAAREAIQRRLGRFGFPVHLK